MSALATRFSTATTKFQVGMAACAVAAAATLDRKSTRLNSSHSQISYAVFCLKKKNHHRHPRHLRTRRHHHRHRRLHHPHRHQRELCPRLLMTTLAQSVATQQISSSELPYLDP